MILVFVALSLCAIAIYGSRLRNSLACAPQLHAIEPSLGAFDPAFPTVSVIIPAYNEAENIHDCITGVLDSTQLPATKLDVWVVDDQSTDDTLLLAQSLQEALGDSRLHVLPGQSRPTKEIWVCKNWACCQGFEQAKGEFLLFIDADVRLKLQAIETAVQKAQLEASDLLSLAPAITCGCLAEWLVQPLMVNNLAVGQDFQAVNDPQTDVAFAAGLAIVAIFFHYYLRLLSSKVSQLPLDYWWLGNIGGTIIAAMALVSVFKTETGWGWTWRGRVLKLPT